MSQSNKRSRGGSGSGGNRTGSQRPQGQRTQGPQGPRRSTSASGQPVRRPPARGATQSPLRANVDRTLPPFSARRYIAIWAGIMVPLLVVVLLLLTQCNSGAANNTSNSANATATPV